MDVAAKRVNVFVYNNCSRDARVLKEAASLTRAGYSVKIVAVLDNRTVPFEERDGFEIHRVKRDSVHVKVISVVRTLFGILQRLMLFPFKVLTWILLRLRLLHPVKLYKRISNYMVKTYGWKLKAFPETDVDMRSESAGEMARIIRNPHRFPIKDYFRALFSGTTAWGKFLGIMLGVIGLPFYIIARLVFLGVQASQNGLVYMIRTALMPFHRASVFKDYYVKAARFCEEHPAQFLHFHDLHTLPIIDQLSDPSGKRMVYDSHELYTEIHTLRKKQVRKYRAIETEKILEVDHVITVNPSIARELSERYGVKEPTVVMNCPPAMKKVPERSDLLRKTAGLDADDLVILYQGGYSTGRGLEELIRAMQWVTVGKLVMMGWGPIEPALHALAKDCGVEDKVKFIPPASQDEVLDYTCGADIGTIPYRAIGLNNYYTSPNKLFEYIQAYVVVAGSNFPELERTIGTHELGMLFDPEDPKSIAECLNEMGSDRDRLKRWRENVKKASLIYNWENEEKKLVQIYNNLGGKSE